MSENKILLMFKDCEHIHVFSPISVYQQNKKQVSHLFFPPIIAQYQLPNLIAQYQLSNLIDKLFDRAAVNRHAGFFDIPGSDIQPGTIIQLKPGIYPPLMFNDFKGTEDKPILFIGPSAGYTVIMNKCDTISPIQPKNPEIGDLWINGEEDTADSTKIFIYDGYEWINICPSPSNSDFIVTEKQQIQDTPEQAYKRAMKILGKYE